MDNQTDEEFMEDAAGDAKGTGIFLIPDPTGPGPGSARKEFLADVTYPECVLRGRESRAYRWVPNRVRTLEELRSESCGRPCVKRCVGSYGCICNTARGFCE